MRPPYRDQRPRLYLSTMTAGLKKDDLTGHRHTNKQTDRYAGAPTASMNAAAEAAA